MKRNQCTNRARRALATLGFLGIGLSASVGRAVPPEYLRNIALHPTDPKVFALRFESAFGGLLFSRDGGQSFQMVPALTFYKYSLQRDVPMVIGADGKLQIALDSGLVLDDGAGCIPAPTGSDTHPSDPAVKGLWIADVVPHPTDPDTSFLLSTGDTQTAHSGVWRRKQGVVAPIGMSEPAPAMPGKLAFIASSLRVVARTASMDGVRLFEAGTKYDHSGATPVSTPVLRVSDNLGATWTTYTIPDPNKTAGNAKILIVDGSEPFKAIVFLENGFGEESDDPIDPLFITKDGGKTFTPYLDKIQAAGEALLLPSGQILLGDRGATGGLWSAANFDAAPTKVFEQPVECLAYQAQSQKIFMCKKYELGLYDAAANSFCTMLQLREAKGFPSCPSAPLETNTKGIDQLCGGYCGAAHYASAPVCSAFSVQPGRICGRAAYDYDNAAPDPEKRWIEPPGNNDAPRCAGFTGLPDGGTSGAPDAGTGTGDAGSASRDAGADAAVASMEGGTGAVADSATGVVDAPDAAVSNKKKGGGCHVAANDAGRNGTTGSLALLALALGMMWRRAKRERLR